MSESWAVGTVLRHVVTGNRRVIIGISPAGSLGRRASDGPVFHARVMRDGAPVPSGHTADIWPGSMSYPARDWRAIDSDA